MDFGQCVRILVIILAFVAMWSLWDARRKRQYLWTPKLRNIWRVQIGWTFVAAEANIELFYRHVRPTWSAIGVVILLAWTIRAALEPGKYTKV